MHSRKNIETIHASRIIPKIRSRSRKIKYRQSRITNGQKKPKSRFPRKNSPNHVSRKKYRGPSFYIHLFGYYTWRWMPQSPQPFFFPVCRATLLQKEEPYVTVSIRYHRVKSNRRFLRLCRPLVTKINMAEYVIYEYVSCCKRRDVLVDKSCRRRRWQIGRASCRERV